MFMKIKSLINGLTKSSPPAIAQGTLWVDEKTGETYYDATASSRIRIRDIVILQDEIARVALANAATNNGFYYVKTTNQFWFFVDSVWTCVNPFGCGY